jgi:hypothetical protein
VQRAALNKAQLELPLVFEDASGFSFVLDGLAGRAAGHAFACGFVSRQALIERAARDGVPLIEREQIADFFDWYRLEIEAVARSKLAAGTRGAGEHDVMVMDKDLNRPGDPHSPNLGAADAAGPQAV